MEPMVTRMKALDCQVCVPSDWTDEQVIDFAERRYPCGTTTGWHIRKDGDKFLAGDGERVGCAERQGFVHIVLDA
jgi:hypothetical protein